MKFNDIKTSSLYEMIANSETVEVEINPVDYFAQTFGLPDELHEYLGENSKAFKIDKWKALDVMHQCGDSQEFITNYMAECFQAACLAGMGEPDDAPNPAAPLNIALLKHVASPDFHSGVLNADARHVQENVTEHDLAITKMVNRATFLVRKAMVCSYKEGVDDARKNEVCDDLYQM